MNPKDVEEFMIGLGFEWLEEEKQWYSVLPYRIDDFCGKRGQYLHPELATFLYQQTLLSRRDELSRLPKNKLHDHINESGLRKDVAIVNYKFVDERLAELNQLLGQPAPHNREEEK